MTNATPAEIRDQVHKRDATVSQFSVRFTNPSEFVEDLKRDHRAAAITDSILRVAIVNRLATLEEVNGGWLPGGDRVAKGWQAKSVTASYLCRGQLVKLSSYCGVALQEESGLRDPRELTPATALQLRDTLQKVLGAADALKGLEVRGGGLYVDDGEWVATPDEAIEAAPKDVCITCGVDIYHANEAWRAKETKRAEHFVSGRQPSGRMSRVLGHLHDPQIKDRKL
ncbi:MAG TPA: hypothetical protein VIP09_16005 [Dehalococcoidia bacterium]